jgi:hypothetical protein
MKKALLIAVLVMAAPMLAEAKTLKFPSDAPIASIKIPDSWNPKETDTGVDATSSDDAVYLSADVAELKSMDKTVTDAIDFLKEVGVTVDPKTLKETPVEEFNGMQMTTLDWDGKGRERPGKRRACADPDVADQGPRRHLLGNQGRRGKAPEGTGRHPVVDQADR